MEIAKIRIPSDRKFDGISIRDLLLNESELPQRKVFFGYEPKLGTALRDGRWKLILKSKQSQLYDLREDIGETNDLANIDPERVKTMVSEIQAWKEEVRASDQARRGQ